MTRPTRREPRRPRPLKVYGWTTFVSGDHPTLVRNRVVRWNTQVRAIMAAPSMAAVARQCGVSRPAQLFNICETGNLEEIARAMAQPAVALCCPLDHTHRADVEWHPLVDDTDRG